MQRRVLTAQWPSPDPDPEVASQFLIWSTVERCELQRLAVDHICVGTVP